MKRRDWFALAALPAFAMRGVAATQSASHAKTLLTQAVPDMESKGGTLTVVEVAYEPGGASKPHRHGGFVVGYVLEGMIRFQVSGGTERVLHEGEAFYEAPGGVHVISANASTSRAARLLAFLVTPAGAQETRPA